MGVVGRFGSGVALTKLIIALNVPAGILARRLELNEADAAAGSEIIIAIENKVARSAAPLKPVNGKKRSPDSAFATAADDVDTGPDALPL